MAGYTYLSLNSTVFASAVSTMAMPPYDCLRALTTNVSSPPRLGVWAAGAVG
jgi:hypothetical protein